MHSSQPINPSRPIFFSIVASLGLVALISWLDILSGAEFSLSLFYLLPVGLSTWYAGRRWGGLIGVLSSLGWLFIDLAGQIHYTHPIFLVWNTAIRLGFFLGVVLLLAELHGSLLRERSASRTDFLTGAANPRYFYDLLEWEISRSVRYGHPFSLAYMDLDNFKQVNDQFGHLIGDETLCKVVELIRETVRSSDIIGRLGGDEFALLLPETDLEAARVIVEKVYQHLLAGMQANHWPVTFSVGVLGCQGESCNVENVLRAADLLMYTVKNNTKNAVKYKHLTSYEAI